MEFEKLIRGMVYYRDDLKILHYCDILDIDLYEFMRRSLLCMVIYLDGDMELLLQIGKNFTEDERLKNTLDQFGG